MCNCINPYLDQVSKVVIPPTDGTQKMRKTFSKRLHLGAGCGEFENCIGPSTAQQAVEIKPLAKSGTSFDIYNGFIAKKTGVKVEPERLAITTAQFCVAEQSFRGGDLVLIKTGEEGAISLFVAHVSVDIDGVRHFYVDRLARNCVGIWSWSAEEPHRVARRVL